MKNDRSPKNALLPILLGAAAGALLAHLFRKPCTPPVKKQRGKKGMAKLQKVRIGGADQWILIRSEDVENNPIILFLHGGPGVGEMALQRRYTRGLEPYFTVVNWDQRGAGKSYAAGDDTARMTIAQFVDDIGELSRYLLKRFGKEKIVLAGRSWGSAIGMLAVHKFPQLFSAYIGTGQITNMQESETLSYDWTVYQARSRGDRKALGRLKRMGPPPYSGDWLPKFNTQRKYVAQFGGEVWGNPAGGNAMIANTIVFAPEYSLAERLHFKRAVTASMKQLHTQLMEVNLFETVPRVAVPVFFTEGRHDHVVPSKLAARYFEVLEAPQKELIWFEASAHMPDIEESEQFNRMVIEKVRPLALEQKAPFNSGE